MIANRRLQPRISDFTFEFIEKIKPEGKVWQAMAKISIYKTENLVAKRDL